MEPVASALSGRFLSTVPPGKSGCKAFNNRKGTCILACLLILGTL